MATQPNYYNDGDWTNGHSPGFNPFWFPFGNNPTPDTYCKITESVLSINPANYVPYISRSVTTAFLLTYSGAFDNVAWNKTATTCTANQIANPWNGALTTDKILENASNAQHGLSQLLISPTSGPNNYVWWAVIRGGLGRDWVFLETEDTGVVGGRPNAFFNITTGALGTANRCTSGIAPLGNSYYLIWMYYVPVMNLECHLLSAVADNNTSVFAGDTAKGFYVAQGQYQAGTVPGPASVSTTNTGINLTTPYFSTNSDPLAFIVEEAPMQLTDLQKANIRQTYARVPVDQIYPASRVVVRPVMNDIYTGNYFAVSFDNGITSTVFSSRIGTLPNSASLGTDIPPTVPVNVITSVPAKSFQTLPGDTITVVDSGGASYAFVLTTAASAIQSGMAASLTALTGVSARAIGTSLTITWATGTVKSVSGTSSAKMSGTTTSIVFEMPDAAANVTQNTAWTYIPNVMQSLRQVNANSHGGNVGDQTVVWNGPKIICISRVVLATTNTYAIPLSDLPGNDIVATHCQFAKNGTRYINGPKECVVKKTEAFFLPGVTSGINTFADIPRYTPETDPIKWLAAIANANTYAVESVSELTQWKGQILVQERNEVLMADALTTATPGA